MLGILSHFHLRNRSRFAKTNAKRCRKRARAHATLLPATVDKRLDAHAWTAADIKRTDTLGSVNFMCGDTHEIDIHRLNIQRNFTEALRSVRMKKRPFFTAYLADCIKRLDDANLVVDRHHRYEQRI